MRTKILSAMLLVFAATSMFAHGHHQKPLKSEAVNAVRKGDFEQAAVLFVREIKENPSEPRLKQLYSELKTQIRREKLLAGETDPGMIVEIGRPMRQFYTKYGLFGKAEAVDRKIYQAEPNTANGVQLGVTLLNLDRNQEAAELFRKLDLSKAKRGMVLCAALAYARSGDKTASEKLLARFPVGKLDTHSLQLYARCAANNGDVRTASELTARILAKAPEKNHPSLKKNLFASSDFRKIANDKNFQEALKTKSQVQDNCDDCPNRGTSKCEHAGHDGHDHDHKH